MKKNNKEQQSKEKWFKLFPPMSKNVKAFSYENYWIKIKFLINFSKLFYFIVSWSRIIESWKNFD